MPCYKGGGFIENSIKTVEEEVSLFEKDFELVVVIDGFIDEGYEKAKALEQRYGNLKVVGYEKNRGKGYAIQFGFKHSQGEYIAFLDSDLDYHPQALAWFLKIIKEKDADLVIGNRNDKKSTFYYPFVRKIASKGFNIYTNLLFPELKVEDTQAGIKLIKRDAAQKLFQCFESEEKSRGFIFDIYLLVMAKQCGLKIVQSPCLFEMKSSTIGVTH
jgi:glycosyltransferase involved in cell wall biosynthesis